MFRMNQLICTTTLLCMLTVGANAHPEQKLVLDVVVDGRSFVLNPKDETAEAPARGDTFMIRGNIYPGGTITPGGTMEKPGFDIDALEGAIGDWNCRGTFRLDWADILAGVTPHVMSTQHYLLDSGDWMVSDGPEGGVTVTRPILGGTGRYIGARGQVHQEAIGVNETGMDVLRLTFTVATALVVSAD